MVKPAVTAPAWNALLLALCFDVLLIAAVTLGVSAVRACDAHEPLPAAAHRTLEISREL